uniref:Uncharacterized protein n=1 Tax=Sphaerodactylus townsendi TaxID=933632 RepID=A0ACB8FIE2_9SAUR
MELGHPGPGLRPGREEASLPGRPGPRLRPADTAAEIPGAADGGSAGLTLPGREQSRPAAPRAGGAGGGGGVPASQLVPGRARWSSLC